MTPWGEIIIGDQVLGKDGKPWAVIAVEDGEVTLERDGRKPFTFRPDPAAQVQIVFESLSRVAQKNRELDEAIAIAGLYLGGEVVAHQDTPDGPWKVQGTGWTLPDLHSHLTIFHGTTQAQRPKDATISELEAFHLKLHDTRQPPTPHIHTDAPFRKGGKVSWK